MVLRIEKEDNKFRVKTQDFSLDWLPDTAANRKVCVVFLRLMQNIAGKHLFPLQQLSSIVDSNNRQAASQHREDFRACGKDFNGLGTRQRKVNDDVVSAVFPQLLFDPLAEIVELKQKVNLRLQRTDISAMNIKAALESISVTQIRGAIKKRLPKGEAHYKEGYLLKEMMQTFSCENASITGKAKKTVIESELIRNVLQEQCEINKSELDERIKACGEKALKDELGKYFNLELVEVPNCLSGQALGKQPGAENVIRVLWQDYIAAKRLLPFLKDDKSDSASEVGKTAGDLFKYFFGKASDREAFNLEYNSTEKKYNYVPLPLIGQLLKVVYCLRPGTCLTVPIRYGKDEAEYVHLPQYLDSTLVPYVAHYVWGKILNQAMTTGFDSCDLGIMRLRPRKDEGEVDWETELKKAYEENYYETLTEKYLNDFQTEGRNVNPSGEVHPSTILPTPIW
ncbi:hypothetical protein FJZ31_34140 [Candidatus Poribacteria bacterium]|nr:hypothetical protein [Candidatus Poribacteria bacterium]